MIDSKIDSAVSPVQLCVLGDSTDHDAFALSHALSKLEQAANETSLAEKITLVAGVSNGTEIFDACAKIRRAGRRAVIVVDAFESRDPRLSQEAILDRLESQNYQFLRIEGALALLRSSNQFLYPYAKAEVSASVIVVSESDARVLLVKRAAEPFKGMFAIPGGFLRPLMETLEECACRELKEETGLSVSPAQLSLVAVRSELERDNRGQVIDHSYLVILPFIDIQELNAGDDAAQVILSPFADALRMQLAADHRRILRDAFVKYKAYSNPLKRLAAKLASWFRPTEAGSSTLLEA